MSAGSEEYVMADRKDAKARVVVGSVINTFVQGAASYVPNEKGKHEALLPS